MDWIKITTWVFWAGFMAAMLRPSILTASVQAGSSYLTLDPAARPAAMAGSYTAMRGDIDALTANPGGLADLDRKQAAFTHAEWFVGTRFDHLAFGAPSPAGTFAISAIRLGYGDLEGRDAAQQPTGTFNASDSAYSLGYAHTALGGIGWGSALKVLQRKIDTQSSSSYAADFGAVKQLPARPFSVGVSVLNVGPGTRFIDQTDPLPLTLAMGGAYQPSGHLRTELDIKHQPHDALTTAGLGFEYLPLTLLALRAGYTVPMAGTTSGGTWDINNVRGGVGILVSKFRFDYALAPFGDLGLTHRFTLETDFGGNSPDHAPGILQPLKFSDNDPASLLLSQIDSEAALQAHLP
jgi:hypothetical protein